MSRAESCPSNTFPLHAGICINFNRFSKIVNLKQGQDAGFPGRKKGKDKRSNPEGGTEMEIVSFSRFGYGGEIVKVETDLRRGIPATDIVGLPDGAVREAKERVRAAIRNSSLEFPRERILISLSPADLKKEGSAFDLAIALSVLTAQNEFPWENFPEPVLVLGELELSGAVRRVRGTSSAVAGAAEAGIRVFL